MQTVGDLLDQHLKDLEYHSEQLTKATELVHKLLNSGIPDRSAEPVIKEISSHYDLNDVNFDDASSLITLLENLAKLKHKKRLEFIDTKNLIRYYRRTPSYRMEE